MLLYHGTDQEFDLPRPLTHFGTREAATSAPHFRGVLMTFELDIRNPLEVPDSPGGGDLWEWLRSAADRGIITEQEFLDWEKHPLDAPAIRLLESKGYDGLVYTNAYEDPGSQSFVIFRSEQAVRLPVPEKRFSF